VARIGTKEAVRFRRLDSSGSPVTGKATGDFAYTAQYIPDGSTTVTSFTDASEIVEEGSGWYWWKWTHAPGKGWEDTRIAVASGSDRLSIKGWRGSVSNQDLDSIANLVIQPSATLTNTHQLGTALTLTLAAYAHRDLSIPVQDQDGNDVNLSAWNNLRLGLRNDDGTKSWESGTGTYKVTGFSLTGALGLLSGVIPEDLNAATAWPASTAVAVGDVVKGSTADYTAICIVAGTTDGSEPTWGASPGDEVTESGGVKWLMQMDPNEELDAAVAGGNAEAALRWEVRGDESSSAAKTKPIIKSSAVNILRHEVGGAYL